MFQRIVLAGLLSTAIAGTASAQIRGVPTVSPRIYPQQIYPQPQVYNYNFVNPYTGQTFNSGTVVNTYTGDVIQTCSSYNPYTGTGTVFNRGFNTYNGSSYYNNGASNPFGGFLVNRGAFNGYTGASYNQTKGLTPGFGAFNFTQYNLGYYGR